jgi:alpha-galactosidase
MKFGINEKKEFRFGVDGKECLANASIAVTIDGDAEEAFMQLDKAEDRKGSYFLSYTNKAQSLCAEVDIQKFSKINALRQMTRVICNGTHTLTQVASANVGGVCFDENGLQQRLSDGSILIHYCISRWQGEGQWRCVTPEDLGIYTATKHGGERSWYRFDSLSSWSTATYYPLVIIEDKKKGECWFFEVEGGHSWFLEIYGYGGEDIRALCVKMGGADEKAGFAKKLGVGDYYESSTCVYGVVKGGFEEAVKELTAYKRATSLVKGGSPLTFNDYMNCNWTNESEKTLIPLIDKAAELGAEVFCLDDGWQEEQGLWYPANEKFGDKELQGIFDYIKAKGMKVGVWFEFETVPLKLGQLLGTDDCFLYRNNGLIAPKRPLANMRSERLLAYLNERVDALYNMGVRFIKNDHNNTEYIGSTIYGESAGEGLENNEKAFLQFIDGIVKRYPDLIIENCGSGAMRSDNGTLRHFHIQSTSDQENYLSYTSILAGSLALMPPEKAGIWCYPYPLSFDDRMKLELSAEQVETYKNGEQTVFNVINGFMGCMYLSGKIHQADDYNFALLKEGIDLYKRYISFIRDAYPVFPRGMIRLSDRTYNAVGLINSEKTEMLLAVWNLSNESLEMEMEIEKYGMTDCQMIYPIKKEGFAFSYEKGRLRCSFEHARSARLLRLERKK